MYGIFILFGYCLPDTEIGKSDKSESFVGYIRKWVRNEKCGF